MTEQPSTRGTALGNFAEGLYAVEFEGQTYALTAPGQAGWARVLAAFHQSYIDGLVSRWLNVPEAMRTGRLEAAHEDRLNDLLDRLADPDGPFAEGGPLYTKWLGTIGGLAVFFREFLVATRPEVTADVAARMAMDPAARARLEAYAAALNPKDDAADAAAPPKNPPTRPTA